ncbi:prepilin peptidase [Thiofaba sp. EF100]|uniref:A24 family peptidase n=1 Tax=Thiofaba sp. EF100 TaxID=3121274 RepID=UPI0032217DD8
MHDAVYLGLLAALFIPAVITDIRDRRIPNVLTLPFWFIGIAAHAVLDGLPGLKEAGLGWLILFAMTLPFWLLGWMGAGDVKLMAAVGALVGADLALDVLLGIVLTGLILAVIQLIRHGLLLQSLRRFIAIFGFSMAAGRPTYIEPESRERGLILPYAIPIAIGTLAALVFRLYIY